MYLANKRSKVITLKLFSAILSVLISFSSFAQSKKEHTINLSSVEDTSQTVIENNPFMPNPTPLYKSSIKIGLIADEGKEFKCVVFETISKKYSRYSFLWIDNLSNGKYDFFEDYLDQMYIPFTLNNKSYVITEIDSLGNFIRIAKADETIYPPIDIGLKAPEIIRTTIDKHEVDLRYPDKKYRAVYFWGCMYPLHFREFNKVVEHFKYKDVQFICLSSKDDYLKTQKINWAHIELDGWEDPIRLKYQTGSLPKLFVVDENNIIQYMIREVQAKYLIEAIEQVIR